jgi:hypothetical protein
MSEFDYGWIEIRRTSQYFASLRAIDIFVDGVKAGSVKNGEHKVFEVSPGQHKVFAKIDWCKTPVSTVDISAGETTALLCGSEIAGWKVLLTSIYLFMPHKMIYLKKSADTLVT